MENVEPSACIAPDVATWLYFVKIMKFLSFYFRITISEMYIRVTIPRFRQVGGSEDVPQSPTASSPISSTGGPAWKTYFVYQVRLLMTSLIPCQRI